MLGRLDALTPRTGKSEGLANSSANAGSEKSTWGKYRRSSYDTKSVVAFSPMPTPTAVANRVTRAVAFPFTQYGSAGGREQGQTYFDVNGWIFRRRLVLIPFFGANHTRYATSRNARLLLSGTCKPRIDGRGGPWIVFVAHCRTPFLTRASMNSFLHSGLLASKVLSWNICGVGRSRNRGIKTDQTWRDQASCLAAQPRDSAVGGNVRWGNPPAS